MTVVEMEHWVEMDTGSERVTVLMLIENILTVSLDLYLILSKWHEVSPVCG